MPYVTLVEASAGAWTVGTNIMSGHRCQQSSYYRNLAKAAIVGSAAVGDSAIEMYHGNTFIGNLVNSSGAASLVPLEAKDLKFMPTKLWAKPGEPFNVIVTDCWSLTSA